MKNVFLLFLLMSCIQIINAQKVLQLSFDEPTFTTTATDSVSQNNFGIDNHFNRPERIGGVKGNALRLDGWTTWIEENGYSFTNVTNTMTIEAWHATEAFTAAAGGIISQINGPFGFSLEVSPFGEVIWAFHADGQFYFLKTALKLPKYQWNHIAATIDLPNQVAKIYVNGVEEKSLALGTHTNITFTSNTPLYVGRQTNDIQVYNFTTSALNGALDELNVYNSVLSPTTIASHYQQGNSATVDLTIDPEIRHQGDILRPKYHPMPNTHWANEAYGLIYHNNKYHLFFQKNPNGPYLNFMHWGHLSSPDLVNWTEEKIVLAPEDVPAGFDNHGVWSGTTIKDSNGIPRIFYTGVNGANAGIGYATPDDPDLINWTKGATNPLIATVPNTTPNLDFRDPYVWEDNGTYHMVVGSGRPSPVGGFLFEFTSPDLINWTNISNFYFQNESQYQTGFFWEMPFVYKYNATDYLLQVTHTYHNGYLADAKYWMGDVSSSGVFQPFDPEPKSFEVLPSKMLAPAFGIDSSGAPVYIGIIVEDGDANEQIARGWRQTFSLPRVLSILPNNKIGHVPHPNLEKLRKAHYQITNRTVTEGSSEWNIPEIESRQMELHFQMSFDSAAIFNLHLFKHYDKQENTIINFNTRDNRISVNRSNHTLSAGLFPATTGNYQFRADGKVDVRIFLDNSTYEIFLDGTDVFSGRLYTSRAESDKIDLTAFRGNVTIDTLDAWQMANDNPIYTGINVSNKNIAIENEPSIFKILPNPNRGQFQIELLSNIQDTFSYQILDVQGRVLVSKNNQTSQGLIPIATDLAAGVYFLKIQIGERVETQPLIIDFR